MKKDQKSCIAGVIALFTDPFDPNLQNTPDSGDTGVRNIAYDARGNVEYLGEQRLIYDATDRPRVRRSTGAGNGYGKYRYDGHGRRISAWERENGQWAYRYNAYDASGALVFVVEEENQFPYNDTITHYVKQDGQTVARVKSTSLNSTPEITWLHHDHLGSAVAGTKADGTTAWTEKYTPFGISMVNAADNDNQAGFTGHIKDSDTGLTYMQARYYDPVIGRFLSHDPVQFSVEQPLMFNRYGYTFNNPVNLIDPDGRRVIRPINGRRTRDGRPQPYLRQPINPADYIYSINPNYRIPQFEFVVTARARNARHNFIHHAETHYDFFGGGNLNGSRTTTLRDRRTRDARRIQTVLSRSSPHPDNLRLSDNTFQFTNSGGRAAARRDYNTLTRNGERTNFRDGNLRVSVNTYTSSTSGETSIQITVKSIRAPTGTRIKPRRTRVKIRYAD